VTSAVPLDDARAVSARLSWPTPSTPASPSNSWKRWTRR
jgi:hypothetical protein